MDDRRLPPHRLRVTLLAAVGVAVGAGVVVASLVSGCRADALPFSESDADLPVVTDGSDFRIGAGDTAAVWYVVGNRAGRPVYLRRCGDRLAAALDRWTGSAWSEVEAGACPAGVEPVDVGMGATEVRRSSHPITAPGTYRLRIGSAGAPGASLVWSSPSNAFVVR